MIDKMTDALFVVFALSSATFAIIVMGVLAYTVATGDRMYFDRISDHP